MSILEDVDFRRCWQILIAEGDASFVLKLYIGIFSASANLYYETLHRVRELPQAVVIQYIGGITYCSF